MRRWDVVWTAAEDYAEVMRKSRQLISIYLGTALAGVIGGGIGGFLLGAPSTALSGMVGGGLGGLMAAYFFRPGRDL